MMVGPPGRERGAGAAEIDPRAFEAAFRVGADPAAFVGQDGLVKTANLALSALAGRDPPALVGRPFTEIFAEPARSSVASLLRGASAWSEASAEARIARADAAEVPVDVQARLFVTRGGERLLHVVVRESAARARRERVRSIALDVSRAANAATTKDEVASRTLSALVASLPELEYAVAYAVDRERAQLVALAHRGVSEDWVARHGVRPLDGKTLLAHVVESREGVMVLDVRVEPLAHATVLPPDVVSILAVPVMAGDEVVGGLLAGSARDRRLEFDDLAAIEVAAAEMGSAFRRLDATRRLAAAEHQFRLLAESVSDAVLFSDARGGVVEANPAARALLRAERGPRAAIRSEAFAALLSEAASRGAASADLDFVADGRARKLHAHGVRVSAEPDRVLVFLEDASIAVRDRRLARLSAAFNAVGVAAAPGQFPFRDLVKRALEAADATAAAFVVVDDGVRIAERASVAADAWARGDLAPRVAALAARVVKLGEPAVARWDDAGVDVAVLPARGRAIAGALVLAHPLADGAAFEEEDRPRLRAAADELARVLQHHDSNERTRASLERERETAARVRRLNEEIEEFTLWTTHDLREPLRSLATIGAWLKEDVDRMDRAEVASLADQLARGADLLKDRVLALHRFSTVARGSAALATTSLQDVAERVVGHLSKLIEERGARVEIAPGLPEVRAQAGRIELVISNLVENGVKYGRAEGPVVRVSCAEAEGGVELVVDDNGEGVPPEIRDQVFRLFYRGANQARATGTGAGLAIVKRIALQHGGDARVETSPEGGARFVVWFPQPPVE